MERRKKQAMSYIDGVVITCRSDHAHEEQVTEIHNTI